MQATATTDRIIYGLTSNELERDLGSVYTGEM
jgi:hypothetical protein